MYIHLKLSVEFSLMYNCIHVRMFVCVDKDTEKELAFSLHGVPIATIGIEGAIISFCHCSGERLSLCSIDITVHTIQWRVGLLHCSFVLS